MPYCWLQVKATGAEKLSGVEAATAMQTMNMAMVGSRRGRGAEGNVEDAAARTEIVSALGLTYGGS